MERRDASFAQVGCQDRTTVLGRCLLHDLISHVVWQQVLDLNRRAQPDGHVGIVFCKGVKVISSSAHLEPEGLLALVFDRATADGINSLTVGAVSALTKFLCC